MKIEKLLTGIDKRLKRCYKCTIHDNNLKTYFRIKQKLLLVVIRVTTNDRAILTEETSR